MRKFVKQNNFLYQTRISDVYQFWFFFTGICITSFYFVFWEIKDSTGSNTAVKPRTTMYRKIKRSRQDSVKFLQSKIKLQEEKHVKIKNSEDVI